MIYWIDEPKRPYPTVLLDFKKMNRRLLPPITIIVIIVLTILIVLAFRFKHRTTYTNPTSSICDELMKRRTTPNDLLQKFPTAQKTPQAEGQPHDLEYYVTADKECIFEFNKGILQRVIHKGFIN